MKLIDGTELKKHIESTICYGCEIGHAVPPCGRCYVSTVLRHIDEMPTIDAQPVKHGMWVPNTSLPGQTGFHCSECMFTDKGTYSRRFKRYKRCQNCGARMGVVEDEQAQ